MESMDTVAIQIVMAIAIKMVFVSAVVGTVTMEEWLESFLQGDD